MGRKRFISVLALLLALVLLATGCGSSGGGGATKKAEPADPAEAAKAAVEACMQKLESGDLAGAAEYFTEEAKEDDFFTTTLFSESELTDSILESTGLSKDMVGEELQASLDRFTDTFNKGIIKSYSIGEVTAEEDAGTAAVDVEYGFDWNVFNELEAEDVFDEDSLNSYIEEHQEELMAIEDETEQMAALFNGVMPQYIDKMTEMLESSEGASETWNISLVQEDGAWKIDKMLSE